MKHPYPYYIRRMPKDKKRFNPKPVILGMILVFIISVVFLESNKEVEAVKDASISDEMSIDVDNLSLKELIIESNEGFKKEKIKKDRKSKKEGLVDKIRKKRSHRKRSVTKIRYVKEPVYGYIVKGFGKVQMDIDGEDFHPGVDIKVLNVDRYVESISDGKVIFSGRLPGFRKAVIIKDKKYKYVYANLEDVFVNEGESVKKGEILGKAAKSYTGDYILHFEVRRYNKPIPPYRFLSR